jgi:hypothetical protein
MYTHEDYLAFCKQMDWDSDDETSYNEWCYYNSFIAEPDFDWLAELASGR